MKKFKKPKIFGALFMALAIFAMVPTMASAHCDTMDGPTAADGQKAIQTNNVNYVLKWVKPEEEKEIKEIFDLSMKVSKLSPEAKEISEKYFFDSLIRIHRAGENAPFTGVKPAGTPIDEKVAAADKSIEIGNLSPLDNLVPEDKKPELKERFEKVMALKNFDENNIEAGREYIEAYVSFFHFAEGEEEEAHAEESHNAHEKENGNIHEEENNNTHDKESAESKEAFPLIPWTLAGLLAITTIIFGVAYHRKSNCNR